jgi:ligand-binding sensor domain-containing protein
MRLTCANVRDTFTQKSDMKLVLTFLTLLATSALSQTGKVNPTGRLGENHVVTAMDSNDVYIWLGTNQGLFRLNRRNNRKKYYSLSNTGYPSNYVTALQCGKDGVVWIGTNNGLLKYDNYGFIPFTTENSNLPENFITTVTVTPGDELLVSTAHNGPMRMHRNRFQHVQGIAKLKTDPQSPGSLSE